MNVYINPRNQEYVQSHGIILTITYTSNYLYGRNTGNVGVEAWSKSGSLFNSGRIPGR